MWQIRFIILLGFAAVALATAVNYLVQLLMKSGIKKRGASIGVALFLLLLIFIVFLLLIFPPFIDQVQQSLYLLPLAVDKIGVWLMWLQDKVPEQLTVVAQVWIEEVLIKDILSGWSRRSDRTNLKPASFSSSKHQASTSSSSEITITEIGFANER